MNRPEIDLKRDANLRIGMAAAGIAARPVVVHQNEIKQKENTEMSAKDAKVSVDARDLSAFAGLGGTDQARMIVRCRQLEGS